MLTISIRYKPGTNLTERIKHHRSWEEADRVAVSIPEYSTENPKSLACAVEKAERETGLTIWINNYFSVQRGYMR